MSKTSQDKLPQYVYRTPFGVYRLRRNVPKDIVEVSGRKLWYKVLGKDYKDAMRAYSTALLEFDRFVATYRNEAPVRQTMLELVKNEFGADAMLQLARGQIDQNLEGALVDLSAKVEDTVSEEVAGRLYTGNLPEQSLTIAECLDRHLTYKLHGDEERDRLPRNISARAKKYLIDALGASAVEYLPVEELTRLDANKFRDTLLERMNGPVTV